jgi:hypothetical protein
MPQVSYFYDDSVIAVREPEVPDADWVGGVNVGGSSACGIGLNLGVADLAGTPEQFTLLDQDGDVRAPQVSQAIGGEALGAGISGKGIDALRFGDPSVEGDGIVVGTGNSTLNTLATGWESV